MRLVDHNSAVRVTVCLALAAALSACGRGSSANSDGAATPGGRGGGPPAMGVTIETLQAKPVQEVSEVLATVRGLRSITVQPEVEGKIVRILVHAGQVIPAGAPVVQIDPEKQAATVRSTESTRAGREADVTYWRQQVSRLKTLVEAGAISRQEFDQAENQLHTAEAALDSVNAQVREGQVQLQYYQVKALAGGTVGDIPVRVGDRVTTDTMITTIDDRRALEAYLPVPLAHAADLHTGVPVELLDEDGKVVATNPVTFVAPRVDPATQTILAKVTLKNMPGTVRVEQFARARLIWRSAPGLTVPVVAVVRIGGQYFCFVAEQNGQSLVARQKPIQVGEVIGNDYVVTSGLKAGDRLIVSGIQKIGDGAPVSEVKGK